jgi:signal peptidase II
MFWLIFLLTLLLDQFTKLMAPKFVDVTYNFGLSLSLFSNFSFINLTLVGLVMALVIAWLLRDLWSKSLLASGLFWGGLVSNLLDRVLFGKVLDWLQVFNLSIKNNLADYAIVVGLIIILLTDLRHTDKTTY